MEEIDTEILKIMRDGGRRICEDAIGKWRSGQYGPMNNDQIQENILLWKEKERKIDELYFFLKGINKGF